MNHSSSQRKVLVFFYGSYMNRKVLAEAGLHPENLEPAAVSGFDIRIAPLANLVPSRERSAYGVLAEATHEELARLYAHARDVLGGVYLPEAVLARSTDGSTMAALCYIAPHMDSRAPSPDYVDRIVAAAREFGFPEAYVARLESFRP